MTPVLFFFYFFFYLFFGKKKRALEADPEDEAINDAYADFLEKKMKNKKLAIRHR
jgi:hypothetical protein